MTAPSVETASDVILDARGIKRVFPSAEVVNALRGVDVQVRRGEMLVIVGASGAGKSTLLHILGLLDTPTAGQIFFKGQDLALLNAEQQSHIRNESFGFVFQFYNLLPEFTALENTLMPKMIQHGPLEYFFSKRRSAVERAKYLLKSLGLENRLSHRPAQLSGGEKQRVAIARALINEPRVVFCDEPTGNLDSENAEKIHAELRRLSSEGQAFVVVTHNEAMMGFGHRRLRMKDGLIV